MDAINQSNNYSHMAQEINRQITADNNVAAKQYHDTLNQLRGQATGTMTADIEKASEKAARIYQVGTAYRSSAPLRARWSGVASSRDTNAPEGMELDGGETGEEGEDALRDAVGGAESTASKVAKYGLKGAAIGLAGMDIAEDISAHGIAGENWEEKVGNVGNIAGGVLETAGMIVPVLAPELELAAGVVNVASTIFSDIGDIIENSDKKKQAHTDETASTQTAVVEPSSLVSQNLVAKPMTE